MTSSGTYLLQITREGQGLDSDRYGLWWDFIRESYLYILFGASFFVVRNYDKFHFFHEIKFVENSYLMNKANLSAVSILYTFPSYSAQKSPAAFTIPS